MADYRKKISNVWSLVLFGLAVSSCSKIKLDEQASTLLSSSSGSGTYTCFTSSNSTQYDTLLACQLLTGAQCSSSLQTFPNGSSATCFTPQATDCYSNPPHWNYTAYTVSAYTTGGYLLQRSLLGCSRPACLCQGSPSLNLVISYGPYVPYVSGLPSPCTVSSCSPYVFQGNLGISGLNFTLSTNPPAIAPSYSSSDIAPVFGLTGGPAGFTMKVYSDQTCSTLSGTTVLDGGGNGSISLSVNGGGLKKFYAILTNGSSSTSCSYSGQSYYQTVIPSLFAPNNVIVPSNLNPLGSSVSLSFSNGDNTGMTYICKYDNSIDGSGSNSCPTGTLGGGSFSFVSTTGVISWTPPTSPPSVNYEFCVTGTNSAGSNTKCASVYLVNNVNYALTSPATTLLSGQQASTSTSVTLNVPGAGPQGLKMYLYQDSNCNTSLNSAILSVSGTGSVSGTVTGTGLKNLFVKYEEMTDLVFSKCINTNKSYYRVDTPVLNQPSNLVYPSSFVLTGVNVNLDFHALDPLGVSYSACKVDPLANGSISSGAPDCSSVGAGLNASGILSWTPDPTETGPFEFCVTGTQQLNGSTNTKCGMVNVVPQNLIMNQLVHYYDAQFASPGSGGGINTQSSFRDLVGFIPGSLMNFKNTTDSGWAGSGTTASPFLLRMNRGSGTVPTGDTYFPFVDYFHEDYVDLASHLNSNQSITFDLWIKPEAAPTTTDYANFNLPTGHPQLGWYDFGTDTYYNGCYQFSSWQDTSSDCPDPYCTSTNITGGCSPAGYTGSNFYPFNSSNHGLNFFAMYTSAWQGTAPTSGTLIQFFDSAISTYPGLKVYLTDSGSGTYKLNYELRSDSTQALVSTCQTTATFNYPDWKHVTATVNVGSSTVFLYVNGSQVCSSSFPSGSFAFKTRKLNLGAEKRTLSGSTRYINRFNGGISSFRIYNTDNPLIAPTNYVAEKHRFGL